MGKINILKRVSYSPLVIRAFRGLGLRHIGRNFYYRWARPRDGTLQVEVAGMSARFLVQTPEELRVIAKAGAGYWDQDVLKLLAATLDHGDTFYDVGSNIGLHACLLAKVVGQEGEVIAFEPEAQNYEHLQDNLRLNGLSNVRAFRLALGECSMKGRLYAGEDLLFSNLIKPRTNTASYQEVQIVAGDEFREAQKLPIPQAVKIDVEGYEYAVIQGLKRTLAQPACRVVCCEVHPTLLPEEVKPERVLDSLKSSGFSRVDVYRGPTSEYHLFACKP